MASQETIICAAHGNVKVSGFSQGTQSWKTGGIQIIQDHKGQYHCRMIYNAGYPQTFPLANNVKRACSFVNSNPGRCMIHLKDNSNLTIDKARSQDVAKLMQIVNAQKGVKTPVRPINGVKKSPNSIVRSTPVRPNNSPSVTKRTPMSQSRLFSHFGDKEESGTPMNVQDFEKGPILKVPLFSDEDDDEDDINKENMGEVGFLSTQSAVKKTPYQMRKEEGGNIFLQSAGEKLNALKEKKNNDTNQISTSFYGRGHMMSTYASADRFKNSKSSFTSSPKLSKLIPPAQKPKIRTFSFKPKTSAQFVSKVNPYQTKALQGFSNLGNTCYMNAILQSLYGLDGFRDQLVQSESSQNIPPDSLSHAMRVLFVAKLGNKPKELIRGLLLKVKHAISKSATRFSGYLQHDAQEFLCQCMDQLKEDTEKLNKSLCELMGKDDPQLNDLKLQPPTAGNLEFSVMHTIQCNECGETINKEEMFHDLSLDMPRKSKLHPSTIQVALDQFFESEDIEYSCEKCNAREARLSHNFTKLSRYIILNLKRYVYNLESSSNGKVQEEIQIPKFLTLSRHCVATVKKPGGQETPTDEVVMTLPSSPRRKLSFDAPDGTGHSSNKRQKLDIVEVKDSSDEGDQVMFLSDIDSAEEQKPAIKDFSTMTEAEQLSYVLKLSESEVKKKSNTFMPVGASPQFRKSSSDIRANSHSALGSNDRVVPSINGLDSCDVPVVNGVDSCDGPDTSKTSTTVVKPATANGELESDDGIGKVETATNDQRDGILSKKKIVDQDRTAMLKTETSIEVMEPVGTKKTGHFKIAGNQHTEVGGATQTVVLPSDSDEDALPRQAEEGVVRFDVDSDSSAGEGLYVSRKEVDFVSPKRKVDESGDFSGPDISRDDLKAKEEEELRKATELSLQDQKNASLREEEEIRKAQELSLQEYQKSSPPPLPQEVQEENPQQPLYTQDEWLQLDRNAREGDMPNSYRLVSVVSHMGSSLTVGHYVSDVYDSKTKKWLSYDDSNVTVIPAAKVREDRRKTGYIFFYEKIS